MQLDSWDGDARFAFTHSLNPLHPSLRHDTRASRACKRRRPSPFSPYPRRSGHAHRTCTMRSRKSSDASARRARELDAERERVLRDHLPERGVPPLGAPPSAAAGFDGWWEGDDAYWQDLKLRELAFRAPTTAEPADYDMPSQPLDRHGRPVRYPAAARYDYDVGDWVPTTEEEEEVLRRPHPVVDPYFVAEAGEGEAHTTLKSRRTEEREPVVVGGLEFSEPLITDMSEHRRKRLDMAPGAWRVVHLGTSSAVPTKTRNVSSTAVVTTSRQVKGGGEPSMFLVDVGENTDDRLIQCDWCMTHGFRWIRAIFITHLHGDHIYGLPMLLATIGKYAQHRRRRAVENGDDGSEPVIRIYGPYGTRGFVRASLFWDDPVGVRFSISELVPRDTDFLHLHGGSDYEGSGEIFVMECGSTEIKAGVGIDVSRESAPPHPEEVRVEDTHVGEDGLWHVWEEDDGDAAWEVVAAPLRHRMPCFGYVFRERVGGVGDSIVSGMGEDSDTRKLDVHSSQNGTASHGGRKSEGIEIDKVKAKALGVHGTQFRVLRSGRSITVSKTGLVVSPDDVMLEAAPRRTSDSGEERTTKLEEIARAGNTCLQYGRKVTILGDTCDSSAIAEAAMDSELLIHEATFTDELKSKAKLAMHSTARMAGEFGRRIRARKLALTHFSSRYEMFMMKVAGDEQAADAASPDAGGFHAEGARGADGGGREGEDNCASGDAGDGKTGQDDEDDYASPNQLVLEAYKGFGDKKARIIAAYDFLEHDVPPRPILQPGHSKNGIDVEYAGLAEGAQIVQASVE